MSDGQVQEGELSHGVDGSDCGIFLQSRLSPSTTLNLVDPYVCFSKGLKSAFVSAFMDRSNLVKNVTAKASAYY